MVLVWAALLVMLVEPGSFDANGEVIPAQGVDDYDRAGAAFTIGWLLLLLAVRQRVAGPRMNLRSDVEELALITGALWLVSAALPVSLALLLPLALLWRPFIEARRHRATAAIGADDRRAAAHTAMRVARGTSVDQSLD